MTNQSDTNKIVKDAEIFYKSLCESKGIIETSASDDVAPGVKLKHLIDSQGWLPFIMIRSDEISRMLTGQKMWDAFYVSDPMALRGLSVADFDSLGPDQKEQVDPDTRPTIAMPSAAKAMIGLAGLKTAINFKNEQCYLRNLPKAYFINGLISEGECLPDLPVELFFSMEINQHVIDSAPALSQIAEYAVSKPEVSR